MKQTLIRGLLNLLPMALSLWLFWSLFESLDSLGKLLFSLLGMDTVFIGAGFILVTALVFIAGLLFSVSPIVWLWSWIERQLMRFPLFKSVYGSIRDIASLMNRDGSKPKSQQTVLVRQANGGFVVGFIMTDKPPQPLLDALPDGDWVPVLFQLSYQMAGVTSLVKREDLIMVDWSFEEAMRFNLTAGISQTPKVVKD
ncbi:MULTISPECIES: DUF502 domain-containing protein [Shewanella]|jgi:uncharacterized membrane protein|uniref:DUF502 domain-containing protein n=2 Tax=Shewanella chilikensis TaxID=558541 RepID=A0A6G7LT85_9GAMM|nr:MULTISPECIES: DUF502 domain-containing protein [Shewanella]MBZ4679103.1 hypothetical protein [Shewanella sp.]MCA0951025.1 DUF502 domain-containing protein [Shewanella chilikensis]MCL1154373.1 DUF502 domain-containing protein [Shewanella chilikensis]MCL1160369.1 DUF502 domain-containing protein [Shewanella chilikensis]PYE58750.1 putative membrane protein [Shewanella chilikensis]